MSVPAVSAPAPTAVPRPLLKTPDLTPAQFAAAATGVIGLAIALGVPLSHDKQLAIETFVTAFAPILIAVDAWIRYGRAKYVHTALLNTVNLMAAAQPLAAAFNPQGNGGGEQAPAAAEAHLPPYIT
jgi:hypothetical protein